MFLKENISDDSDIEKKRNLYCNIIAGGFRFIYLAFWFS